MGNKYRVLCRAPGLTVWMTLGLVSGLAWAAAMPALAQATPRAVSGQGSAPAPAQKADRAFYERAILLAADEKCRLFAPDLRRALRVSEAQARGAALRAGLAEPALARIGANAKQAIALTPCLDPEITGRATRARDAFAQFRLQKSQDFAGNQRIWRARRIAPLAGWVLVQDLSGAAQFGLWRGAGPDAPAGFILAAPVLAGQNRPIAAKLILRDRDKRATPILSGAGIVTSVNAPGLTAPPPAFTTTLWARERLPDPEEPATRIRFAFGDEAGPRLAGLDPREAVILRLHYASGPPRDFLMDTGDFAAAWAFVGG